jgi:hypothetical protein
MKWQITIARPPDYKASQCFQEVAETLMYGLRRMGETANIGLNVLAPGARHILLGAHLLGVRQHALTPAGSILYNFEPFTTKEDRPSLLQRYVDLARRMRVWDYSPANLAEWKRARVTAKVVPIGYVPEIRKVFADFKFPDDKLSDREPPEQHIDVLFYGALNPRRQAVLEGLKHAGLTVTHLEGIYGVARDDMIARAKVVLNLHFYESRGGASSGVNSSIFEMVRVSYLMANGVAVVTEDSVDIPDDLRPGLAVVPYGALVQTCRGIVNSPERRRDLERTAFECFRRRPEEEILRAAIAA